MSYEHVDAVFPLNLPTTEKTVLLALCRHAHKDGSCSFPSVNLLTFETGCSERTVQRALRALEGRDFIRATSSKAGGRHGQTVSYQILIPNADVIAAVKALWKQGNTGAADAPDEGDTGASVAPLTGGAVAPDAEETGLTGASVAPTGASVAPKAVREPVREPVTTSTTTTPGAEAGASAKSGHGTASKMLRYLADKLELKALPSTAKQRAELEALDEAHGKHIMSAAMEAWSRERNITGLRQPLFKFLEEIPDYIAAAVAAANAPPPGELPPMTAEDIALDELRTSQQQGFDTVSEWKEYNRKIEQDVAYEIKGAEIMRELRLQEQGQEP